MDDNTTLVQMELRPETVSDVIELQGLLGVYSKVTAVVMAVKMALLVIHALANDRVVLIENDKGHQERLFIDGVGKTRESGKNAGYLKACWERWRKLLNMGT